MVLIKVLLAVIKAVLRGAVGAFAVLASSIFLTVLVVAVIAVVVLVITGVISVETFRRRNRP